MLRSRFQRLFELSLDHNVFVADMRKESWGFNGVGWRWRRSLVVWEEEQMVDCARLLDDIFFLLQDNINDKWTWKHDLVEG